MPKSDLVLWYDFLWSRTRAIRKELTQQMMVDKLAVELVEKCTRFHIYAAFRMADLEVSQKAIFKTTIFRQETLIRNLIRRICRSVCNL
jgi:hypothetical protein